MKNDIAVFFENSPLSLWEEDISAVMEYMDTFGDSGIENIEDYFNQHPEEVIKCATLIRILDINPATIEMFEAKDKEEMITKMSTLFSNEVHEMFKQEFISFYKGQFRIEVEGNVKTLKGGEKYVHMIVSSLSQHRILVSMTDLSERKTMEKKLHLQATTDPLTKIFNRRYFFNLALEELKRSQRYNRPFSIILFDIDYFKRVNDMHGHAAGDEVLYQLTSRCQDILRETDIFARYGGEEFVILLPESNQGQAFQMAERIRKTCAETPFDITHAVVNLTISLGVSSLNNKPLPLDELLLQADKALYQSKSSGRNKVTTWEEESGFVSLC